MDNKKQNRERVICEICQQSFMCKRNISTHIKRRNHYIHSTVGSFLEPVLPNEPKHFVEEAEGNKGEFLARICLPQMKCADKLREWMDEFMRLNNCVYVRRSSKLKHSESLRVFKVNYSCQHFRSADKSQRRTKGTNCTSKINASVTLKPACGGCNLVVRFNHNHPLDSASVLSYRQPTPEVTAYFKKLFIRGMKPSTALDRYTEHIRSQLSDEEYAVKCIDRSVLPDFDWVKHYFRKLAQSNCQTERAGIVHKLKEFIKIKGYESSDDESDKNLDEEKQD